MRRHVAAVARTAGLFLVVLTLLVTFRHYFTDSPISFGGFRLPHGDPSTPDTKETNNSTSLRNGNDTLLQMAPAYVQSIMTPGSDKYPRLQCPSLVSNRYDYLRSGLASNDSVNDQPTYFFALDLHQNLEVLPSLLGAVVEAVDFLGPRSCVISIVEGRSDDGTFEVLKLLQPAIQNLGARYLLTSSDLDPLAQNSTTGADDRVYRLARLRNLAIRPLMDRPEEYSENTTVIFLNDVALCMEDILELLHQRQYQNADMTCAMDWTYAGQDPTFYDVWVARGMNGDSFFEIPPDGSWNSAWNLFWNNPTTQAAYNAFRQFQVFSCWNGATAFTAKPVMERKIRFRGPYENECPQGEPQLFCKEMWYHGYGKIAVVPTVNLEYSVDAAQKIKDAKGYVSRRVMSEGESPYRINWSISPPNQVKCMPSYDNQTWAIWDEQLIEHATIP